MLVPNCFCDVQKRVKTCASCRRMSASEVQRGQAVKADHCVPHVPIRRARGEYSGVRESRLASQYLSKQRADHYSLDAP